MRWLSGLLLLLALPQGGAAQVVQVASTEVSDVSVTLYRDPDRGEGPINTYWPGGYALISETRTITIPAGEAIIRFEGVAEGMLPESAIVTGLPSGVREKNRDARLISPAGLVDAYLKRRVTLTRTNRKTGKVTKQDAIIQAGPSGGVIVKTPEGVEALGCSGLPERMLYEEGVPDGLSAKPTLSVLTTSKQEVRATVTLTYLAQGFDWSAHYVGEAAKDGVTLRLLGWATLVNGGSQSFDNARVQLIAGRANYQKQFDTSRYVDRSLRLTCWPMDVTSTYPSWDINRLRSYDAVEDMFVTAQQGIFAGAPPPSPPPPPMAEAPIAVTALMKAQLENLGDLKLYRVPERVTVAAQGQKQVAIVVQEKVKIARVFQVYGYDVHAGVSPAQILIDAKNDKDGGLGIPLPSGAMSLYEVAGNELLFVGEDPVRDFSVGEEVRYKLGLSALVQAELTESSSPGPSKLGRGFHIKLTNAHEAAVPVEVLLAGEPIKRLKGMSMKRGQWVWRVTVPANGEFVGDY